MASISPQLNSVLNDFAQRHGNSGGTAPEALRQMLAASPTLLEQLNQAAQQGTMQKMELTPPGDMNGRIARFSAEHSGIYLNEQALQGMQDPSTAIKAVGALGLEAALAAHAQAQTASALHTQGAMREALAQPGVADLTSVLKNSLDTDQAAKTQAEKCSLQSAMEYAQQKGWYTTPEALAAQMEQPEMFLTADMPQRLRSQFASVFSHESQGHAPTHGGHQGGGAKHSTTGAQTSETDPDVAHRHQKANALLTAAFEMRLQQAAGNATTHGLAPIAINMKELGLNPESLKRLPLNLPHGSYSVMDTSNPHQPRVLELQGNLPPALQNENTFKGLSPNASRALKTGDELLDSIFEKALSGNSMSAKQLSAQLETSPGVQQMLEEARLKAANDLGHGLSAEKTQSAKAL